ncbi:MAG: helix-turn-helix domain-containing protein [Mycobacterium sp.]
MAAPLPCAPVLKQRREYYEQWEKSFGDKIRQWRRERNWSQEDVAAHLRDQGFDMHQTTVAKIDSGTRPLRVAEALALGHIFKVPALAIFEGPGPEDQPENIAELQRELDMAEQSAGHRRDEIDSAAEYYAAEVSRIKQIAERINRSAAQQERQQCGPEA